MVAPGGPRIPPGRGNLTEEEAFIAEERGRLMAVGILMNNLEKRKELEAVFGKAYCHRRYPEVYKKKAL